jgi:hypothetical protein
MTERVDVVLGMRCKIIEEKRYVELHLIDRHHIVREKSLERATIVLGNWLSRRGHLKTDQVDREMLVRETLRSIRLPIKPISVTRRLWVRRQSGKYEIRVKLWVDGTRQVSVHFTTTKTEHEAAMKSIRLCEIINAEIMARQIPTPETHDQPRVTSGYGK